MRIAVAVASKHGATKEIGHAVVERLRELGHDVSEHDMASTSAEDLDDAQVLVLGGAVYFGRWPNEANDLVDGLADRVDGRPVWLFSSGPVAREDEPPSVEEPTIAIDGTMQALDAREHVMFGGRLDKSTLSFVERAVARALRAPDADTRDWTVIREWADKIDSTLKAS